MPGKKPKHIVLLKNIGVCQQKTPQQLDTTRRWVKVAESGGLCYTCVMGTWKSKNRHKYLLQYHIIFVCKYRKKLLMSKQISDDIIGQSILFGWMDILPAV